MNTIIGILIICELVILYFALKKGGLFKIIFLNALLGILAVAAINLTEKYTGCYIPINAYTVFFPSAFGLPAVIGLVLLKFIFL